MLCGAGVTLTLSYLLPFATMLTAFPSHTCFPYPHSLPLCSPVLIPPWFKRATTGIFESSYRLATPDGHDWTGIDLRNPWARGHFANHPPPGSSPNVIKAAVDLVISGVDEAWAR